MDLDPKKAQDLENNVNQGVVAPTEDEILAAGVLDLAEFPIIAPDSNIDKFLSNPEAQYQHGFDTLACNIFASINQSEIDLNSKGGDTDLGGTKVELSDRFAAVMAGLNGSGGSSEGQWEHMVSNFGLVADPVWPWLPTLTKDQYFSAIPDNVKTLGSKFLVKYTPFHRPIGIDHASIIEALKYGGVKIFVGTGPGWNVGEDVGVVPVNTGAMNHAVMVRYIDEKGIHIRDQYAPFLKCLDPNYKIFYAFQTLYKKFAPFTYTFVRDLWYGKTDPDCVFLQMILQRDGEFPANATFDQHFGPKTLAAVQQFQIKYGIATPTTPGYGRCGPKTRQKLNQLYGSAQ